MADQMDDEVVHSCALPAECIPLSVVEVVEYLDEDGDRAFQIRHNGDSTISTSVGLLEMAKAQIIATYMHIEET